VERILDATVDCGRWQSGDRNHDEAISLAAAPFADGVAVLACMISIEWIISKREQRRQRGRGRGDEGS
jgi:hypothetical protein